jgi:hypothetical protein
MRIAYIGGKSVKVDNIAGTGLSWTPGQVHEVESPEACRKLLAHSGVWVLDNAAELIAEAKERAERAKERAETSAALELRLQADRDAAARIEADADEAAKEFDRVAAEETAAAERAQAEADAAAAQSPPTPATEPPAGLAGAKVPGSMSLDELMAFCKAKGVKFHPNIKRETLLERLVAHAEGAQS